MFNPIQTQLQKQPPPLVKLTDARVTALEWNSSASVFQHDTVLVLTWLRGKQEEKRTSNMNIFISGFAVLSVLCAILFIYTRTALTTISDAAFRNFQRVYLVVYLLAMGEWASIVGINILLDCKSVFLLVHFYSLCMEEFRHKTTPFYDQLLNCVKHLKNCNIWSNWLWQNRIGLYDQIKLLGNDKRSVKLVVLWKKNMM